MLLEISRWLSLSCSAHCETNPPDGLEKKFEIGVVLQTWRCDCDTHIHTTFSWVVLDLLRLYDYRWHFLDYEEVYISRANVFRIHLSVVRRHHCFEYWLCVDTLLSSYLYMIISSTPTLNLDLASFNFTAFQTTCLSCWVRRNKCSS